MKPSAIDASVRDLGDGIHVAQLPLGPRLRTVNTYLAREADGSLSVLDTGLAPTAEARFAHILGELNVDFSAIGTIIISHFHPDHIGGSGALARRSGAPVIASRVTADQAPRVWGWGVRQTFAALDAQLRMHGMPADRRQQLAHEEAQAAVQVQLPEAFVSVDDGDELTFGQRQWRAVMTPGHADGHMCLFNPGTGTLLAADHLLQGISPAIGLYPDARPNPLADFLASLAKVRALDVTTVLPGHFTPFTGHRERIDELVEHHEARLELCIDQLAAGPRTAYEVCLGVFGTERDVADERFAMTETLAHLEYLRIAGRITTGARVPADGPIHYRRAESLC